MSHVKDYFRRLAQLILLSCLVCAPAWNFAHADEEIAIDISVSNDDKFWAWVALGERQGRVVIDTAATYPLIHENLIVDTGIELKEPVRVLGITGIEEFSTVVAGPVRVGDISLGTVRAAINKGVNIPGVQSVVPASIFPERVIDFDFSKRIIQLYDKPPKRLPHMVTSKFEYQQIERLPFISVRVNGKRGLALIDTGSDATFMNGTFATLVGAKDKIERTHQIFGATGKERSVSVIEVKSLRLGEHVINNTELLKSDIALFEHLGLADQPVMVIGLDTLRKFRVQVDRQKHVIILSRRDWSRNKPSVTDADH